MYNDSSVDPAKAFRFYLREGQPLNRDARDLRDFRRKLAEVPPESVEFHARRGDFSRWVSDVIGNPSLAQELQSLHARGESLKEEISSMVEDALDRSADCPECGAEVERPRKAWAMTGRPSKEGKRNKITIGLFDCPQCSHTFRRAVKKEIVT